MSKTAEGQPRPHWARDADPLQAEDVANRPVPRCSVRFRGSHDGGGHSFDVGKRSIRSTRSMRVVTLFSPGNNRRCSAKNRRWPYQAGVSRHVARARWLYFYTVKANKVGTSAPSAELGANAAHPGLRSRDIGDVARDSPSTTANASCSRARWTSTARAIRFICLREIFRAGNHHGPNCAPDEFGTDRRRDDARVARRRFSASLGVAVAHWSGGVGRAPRPVAKPPHTVHGISVRRTSLKRTA